MQSTDGSLEEPQRLGQAVSITALTDGFEDNRDPITVKYLDNASLDCGGEGPYDGRSCNASTVETMPSMPDECRLSADDARQFKRLDYKTSSART